MSKSIFESWIYEHSKYKSPFEQLVAEIEMVLDDCPPFVFPLLGDSRTGKTTLLKDVESYFSNRLSSTGHPRVIRIPMASAASNESLAVRIIKKVIGDIEVKGKTYQILDRAREALQNAGVLVLLLEEINHQVEKHSTARAQTKENRMVADWFKELIDMAGVSIVISGLTHVKRLYIDNNQLENRGLRGVTLSAYSWAKAEERREFNEVISACLSHFEENGWKVDISSDVLARVAYFGSGGYVGRACDLLARIDSTGKSRKVLNDAALFAAFNEKFTVDWPREPGDFRPFQDDVLLQKAHREAMARALVSGGKVGLT
jgi:hypothetical protein